MTTSLMDIPVASFTILGDYNTIQKHRGLLTSECAKQCALTIAHITRASLRETQRPASCGGSTTSFPDEMWQSVEHAT